MSNIPYYNMALRTIFMLAVLIFPLNLVAQQSGTHSTKERQKPSAVKFEYLEWNFGEIKEDGGKVKHIFTFSNISSRPIVVLDVFASCGCTSPEYSRKPVMPGQKSEIAVEFDPINRPGRFSKGVTLTLSNKERVSLNLVGNVLPRVRTVEELYPFDAGEGVRLDNNFHAFSYLGRGDSAEHTIVVYNTSDRQASLRLEQTKRSGMLSVEAPQQIKPQSLAKIVLRYKVPEDSEIYGSLDDVFKVKVNGRESTLLLSTRAIAVDKFDTTNDDMSSPSCVLTKNFIKFGDVKHQSVVSNGEIEIVNDGEGELIIRALEWKSPSMKCSLRRGEVIGVGQSRKIEITFDSSQSDYGVWVDRLSIFTNDPERPMQSIRVTAIVVDK